MARSAFAFLPKSPQSICYISFGMAILPTKLDHLVNPLVTVDQLPTSSSSIDGITPDLEASVRYAALKLTQAAGVLLRLPQDTIAQAIVLFTRFWVGPEGGSLAVHAAKVRIIGCCGLEERQTWLTVLILTGCISCIDLSFCEAIFFPHVSSIGPQCLRLPPLK